MQAIGGLGIGLLLGLLARPVLDAYMTFRACRDAAPDGELSRRETKRTDVR